MSPRAVGGAGFRVVLRSVWCRTVRYRQGGGRGRNAVLRPAACGGGGDGRGSYGGGSDGPRPGQHDHGQLPFCRGASTDDHGTVTASGIQAFRQSRGADHVDEGADSADRQVTDLLICLGVTVKTKCGMFALRWQKLRGGTDDVHLGTPAKLRRCPGPAAGTPPRPAAEVTVGNPRAGHCTENAPFSLREGSRAAPAPVVRPCRGNYATIPKRCGPLVTRGKLSKPVHIVRDGLHPEVRLLGVSNSGSPLSSRR